MGLHTRLTDLPVTGGSHVSHAILLDRSRPMKHFWARARIELWRGVRDRFSTVSTTVPQSFNVVARGKSGIMLQHGHRSRSLCNRIYYGAGTAGPFTLARLLGFGHRILTGTCARVVRWCPSRRRWKRSKCASVRGPVAKRGAPDRSREK